MKKFYFSFKKSLRWYYVIGSGTNWMQSGGHGDNHRGKFKKIYFWNRLLKWEDTQPHAQYDLKHLLYAPIIFWATYREPLIWDTQIWISLSSSNPPCIYSPWRSIAQWEVVEHVPQNQDVIGLKSYRMLGFFLFLILSSISSNRFLTEVQFHWKNVWYGVWSLSSDKQS